MPPTFLCFCPPDLFYPLLKGRSNADVCAPFCRCGNGAVVALWERFLLVVGPQKYWIKYPFVCMRV